MIRRLLRRLTPALLLSIGLTPAGAQTCHDLAGSWRLDTTASRLGSGLSVNPHYAVAAIDLTLTQAPSTIGETWHLAGPHLDETDRFAVRTDGQAAPTGVQSLLNTMPIEIEAVWQNCTLVEQARTNLFGQTVWTTNTYVNDPTDRHLTILQMSHSDLGDVDRTLLFDRTAAPKETTR